MTLTLFCTVSVTMGVLRAAELSGAAVLKPLWFRAAARLGAGLPTAGFRSGSSAFDLWASWLPVVRLMVGMATEPTPRARSAAQPN